MHDRFGAASPRTFFGLGAPFRSCHKATIRRRDLIELPRNRPRRLVGKFLSRTGGEIDRHIRSNANSFEKVNAARGAALPAAPIQA